MTREQRKNKEISKKIYPLLFIILGSLLLLFSQGYGFCISDQNHYLLSAYRNNDPDFCKGDYIVDNFEDYHFIYNFISTTLERWKVLPQAFFFLHLLNIFFLIISFFRLNKILNNLWRDDINKDWFSAGSFDYLSLSIMLILLIFGPNIGLGDSFFYTGSFLASNMAVPFSIIGLAFLLDEKFFCSGLSFGISGIMHTNIGIISGAFIGIYSLLRLNIFGIRKMIPLIFSYVLLFFPILLYSFFLYPGQGKDPKAGYDILFDIRAPHHWNMQYFKWFIPFGVFCLGLASIIFLIKNDKKHFDIEKKELDAHKKNSVFLAEKRGRQNKEDENDFLVLKRKKNGLYISYISIIIPLLIAAFFTGIFPVILVKRLVLWRIYILLWVLTFSLISVVVRIIAGSLDGLLMHSILMMLLVSPLIFEWPKFSIIIAFSLILGIIFYKKSSDFPMIAYLIHIPVLFGLVFLIIKRQESIKTLAFSAFIPFFFILYSKFIAKNGNYARNFWSILAIFFIQSFILFYDRGFESISIFSHERGNLYDTCVWIRENIRPGNVFLIPVDLDNFRISSRRAIFIDFKAFIRTPDGMIEWLRRCKATCGILELPVGISGFPLSKWLSQRYDEQSADRALRLCEEEKLSHILAHQGTYLCLTLNEIKKPVYENGEWAIFEANKN